MIELTPREQQIVYIMATEPDEIVALAKKYLMSECTLRTHLENIYRKLGVSSRVELVINYYQNKLKEVNNA